MISTSGKSFADFQNRLDARIATIVKITYGSDVWYLGDMEIEWGAGLHVYALLTGCSGMKRAIDPFRKKWSVGEVTLTFSNLPFKKDGSGNWLRPSDDINAVESNPVEIYLLCGENATGLSDCILCFSGLIKEPPKYDENTWNITVIDRSISLMNEILPTKIVGSIYSDAPEEFENEMIPLIYGEFKHSFQGDSLAILIPLENSLGLCKGIPINNETPPKSVFSSHVLHTFETVFWQPSQFKHPAECWFPGWRTLSVNDSGYGTASFIFSSSELPQFCLYIEPGNTNTRGYSFENEGLPVNPKYVWDRKTSTYCILKDNISDNGTTMKGEARFGFPGDPDMLAYFDAIKVPHWIWPGITFDTIKWGMIYRANLHPDLPSASACTYLYYATDGSTNLRKPTSVGDWPLTLDAQWRMAPIGAGMFYQPWSDKNAQYLMGIYASNTTSQGDSTVDNQNMLRIYDLWFVMIGLMPNITYTWGQIKGRAFGSWIDGAGHSNSFDAGDLIVDPAYIIESLLRDELDWATANIDEASFDAAANTSVIMRMNLTKLATVAKIIRQICEQSTFAFHINSAGKARLIPINESSPTTDRTIPFSHIKADTLRTSQAGPFVNWLTYHSCWLPQLQKYRNIEKAFDASSVPQYGLHEHIVYWPNIEGSSRDHIVGHLISSPFYIWSRPKNVIEFETFGFTNADLEIGDWVELDDETWDAQLKLGGASWSGEQFLVAEVTQKQNGTRIKAIAI